MCPPVPPPEIIILGFSIVQRPADAGQVSGFRFQVSGFRFQCSSEEHTPSLRATPLKRGFCFFLLFEFVIYLLFII